jgi:hypothetical protein
MHIDAGLILRIPGDLLDAVHVTTVSTGMFWLSYVTEAMISKEVVVNVAHIVRSFSWLRECFDIIKATSGSTAYPEAYDEIDTTSPGARTDTGPGPNEQLFLDMHRYRNQLKVLLGAEQDFCGSKSGNYFELLCSGRKLFATQSAKFGLGPPEMEEGDLVCALYTGWPLFVLRPVERRDESRQCSQVIGDAYISCFMNGEAFRGKTLDEMQEFCLV